MIRKYTIGVKFNAEELEKLDNLTKKVSRSNLLQEKFAKCIADPEEVIGIFKAILHNKDASTDSTQKTTSIMISGEHIDALEALGDKFGLSRNATISLIIKGIILEAV